MRYGFHPDALDEYLEATAYYAEISPDLGEAFVDAIEHGINQIVEHPQTWRVVEGDVRRYLLHRFPYGIYYKLTRDERVLIGAVMHMSRRPAYWRYRLRED